MHGGTVHMAAHGLSSTVAKHSYHKKIQMRLIERVDVRRKCEKDSDVWEIHAVFYTNLGLTQLITCPVARKPRIRL